MCNLSSTQKSSLEEDNSLNHSCVSPKNGLLGKCITRNQSHPLGMLSFGVLSSDQTFYIIGCKNLHLNIRDGVYCVGHGSLLVGGQLRNLGKFVYPTLSVSFRRYPIIRWSLLPGVSARRSKISFTGGKCVLGRGLNILA